jgi:hypothetical protein
MIKDHIVRFASVRRRARPVALMAPPVSLMIAAPAAFAKEPTGEFTIFKQCPRFTPATGICLYSQITGGVTTINKLTVPITSPITFQGGIELIVAGSDEKLIAALDGETFSNTPQSVPGGLSALIDCEEISGRGLTEKIERKVCKKWLREPGDLTEVHETLELARPASEVRPDRSNEANLTGVALWLPVKIHLENPRLGSSCYIGASAEPLMFEMTTGTTSPPPPNSPIHGSLGTERFNSDFTFLEVSGEHFLVNNTFSAPVATGCGGHLSSKIDPLIDRTVGLPSPSGYNTVIHSGPAFLGAKEAVLESEH